MLQPRKQLVRIGRHAGRRQHRRYESSSHHGSSHNAHHAEPVNEHLGRGFYLTVAAIPLGFALYKFSRSSDGSTKEVQPFFTRMIQKYSDYQESFAERNALHTRVMEQAAHDRNLFANSQNSGYVDLNFPE
ncbi:MAG: hypothetical protein Q9167_003561 [Letrouitia subvulpina]